MDRLQHTTFIQNDHDHNHDHDHYHDLFVVVVMAVVVVKPVLTDEVCHNHTGAHDHHGRTVSLILAFLATPHY